MTRKGFLYGWTRYVASIYRSRGLVRSQAVLQLLMRLALELPSEPLQHPLHAGQDSSRRLPVRCPCGWALFLVALIHPTGPVNFLQNGFPLLMDCSCVVVIVHCQNTSGVSLPVGVSESGSPYVRILQAQGLDGISRNVNTCCNILRMARH